MKVNEIFTSISGEVSCFPQGTIVSFVRFAGCNLRCEYCDTPDTQSFSNGIEMSIDEIIEELKNRPMKVILTGGEPLIQQGIEDLVERLISEGYQIAIETNGTMQPSFYINSNCTIVMDYKLDNACSMDITGFSMLKKTDFIKFVIRDRLDLNLASEIHKILLRTRNCKCYFAYSPVVTSKENPILAMQSLSKLIYERLMNLQLNAVINYQIHKIFNFD